MRIQGEDAQKIAVDRSVIIPVETAMETAGEQKEEIPKGQVIGEADLGAFQIEEETGKRRRWKWKSLGWQNIQFP
ncbi:hypothetical protein [Peribacillus butanolivorans]|uniref:hypothetical protein n=1 Tax=Peribacillus butanolivorans TaxID=421767 RepID=UPI003671BA25